MLTLLATRLGKRFVLWGCYMSTQCRCCATVMLALFAFVACEAAAEGQTGWQPPSVNAVTAVQAPARFLSPRIMAGARPACRGWWPARPRLSESVLFDAVPRDASVAVFKNLFESSAFPDGVAGESPARSASTQSGLLLDLCNDTWDCGSAPRCDPYSECSIDIYRCEVNPRTGYRDCRHVGFCGPCRGLRP